MPAIQKWAMTSRVEDKQARKAAAAALERDVYRAVDRRDANHCRACGRRCRSDAVSLLDKGHHHHLTFRSQQGETSTANVVLLCAQCHSDAHGGGRLRIDGNGDTGIEVWKRQPDGEWYLVVRELTPETVERD